MNNLGPFITLNPEEMMEVISLDISEKIRLIIGGYADFNNNCLVLIRGDGFKFIAPFNIFTPNSQYSPDFNDLSFIDYGNTVKLGGYEASTDAILYELDPTYKLWADGNRLTN